MIIECSKCKGKKFWRLSDGCLKCTHCKERFSKPKRKLPIESRLLRKVIQEFVLEHSTNIILARGKASRYKLLKILTLLRIVMTKDIPEVFSRIVEVDETYLGGQMKNKRQSEKA